MKAYQWVLNLVDKASGPMQAILSKAERVEGVFAKAKRAVVGMAVGVAVMNQVGQAVQGANQEIQQLIAPGVQLQQGMADLQALTGATASQMDAMEQAARRNAKTFGGEAADSARAFQGILGELGPEIAKVPTALTSMGVSVSILSKTMGGDVVGAQQALTTGLQQFGAGLDTPEQKAAEMTRQMNMMAAAARAGSAEVPQIAATMKVAGAAASGANIGFTEFNAATQVLAASSIKGAEAGTGLRNVINKLSEGRFLPKEVQTELKAAGVNIDKLGDKSLTFRQRLDELKKIQNDTALVTKLFGSESQSAASALLKGTASMAEYEDQIVGTHAAQEMAATSMNTFHERMSRAGAMWKDLGISAFQALEPMLPMISTTGQMVETGTRLMPVFQALKSGALGIAQGAWNASLGLLKMGGSAAMAGARFIWTAVTGLGSFILSMISATAAQWGLNIAMNANPIGAIIVGLLALGAAVYMLIKHWDTVKVWLVELGVFMLKMNPFYWLVKAAFNMFPGLETWFKGLWDKITGFLHSLLEKVKWIWDKIAPYLGFGQMNIGVPDISKGLIQAKSPLDPTGAGSLHPDAPGSKPVKNKLDKVSSGGSKPTTVNITFQKFQDKIEINTTTFTEGVNDAVALLEEGLLRVVNGVSQGVGNI